MKAGGESYYFLTRPELAAGRDGLIEPEPYWLGSGAARLDLAGSVSLGRLRALMRGVHPHTGEELMAPGRERTVAAFDLTISVPKSVSVLHAIGGEEVARMVASAHAAAIGAVVTYIEDEHIRVRRSSQGVHVALATDGVAAAVFPHRTSRAHDPHLHSHVLVANLACGTDGRFGAIDGRRLFRAQRELRALVEAHLRYELVRSGVAFGPMRGDFADIATISPEVVREFSRQGQLIAALMREEGLVGPEAAALTAAAARPAKDTSRPYEELQKEWRERGYRVGLSHSRIETAAGMGGPSRAREDQPAARDLLAAAAERGDGSFTRGDVIVSVCSCRPRGAPIAAVCGEVDDALRLTAVPAGSGRFTTPLLRARAEETAERLVRLATETDTKMLVYGSGQSRAAALARAAELAREGARVALSPGHRAARRFEACTGIESVPISMAEAALRGVSEGELVIVSDPAGLTAEEIIPVLTSCAQKGATPVFVGRAESVERSPIVGALFGRTTTMEVSSLDRPTLAEGRGEAIELAPAVSALVGQGLLEACALAAARATDLSRTGAPVRVIVPDRSLLSLVRPLSPAVDVETAVSSRRRPDIEEDAHLVVIGGATVLAGDAGLQENLSRTHVIVRAGGLDPTRAHGVLLEAVMPADLVAALGTPRIDPLARWRWRERALALDAGPSRGEREGERTLRCERTPVLPRQDGPGLGRSL